MTLQQMTFKMQVTHFDLKNEIEKSSEIMQIHRNHNGKPRDVIQPAPICWQELLHKIAEARKTSSRRVFKIDIEEGDLLQGGGGNQLFWIVRARHLHLVLQ